MEMEAEVERVMAKSNQLKKMVGERDEKISSMGTELARLEAAKNEVEMELNRNYDQTKELLK